MVSKNILFRSVTMYDHYEYGVGRDVVGSGSSLFSPKLKIPKFFFRK
jgi:hypothetical protein